MKLNTLKFSSLIVTSFASLAVLTHDTQADKATLSALNTPNTHVASANIAHSEEIRVGEGHIHTENMTESLRRLMNSEPRLQTRTTDDKKYVSLRKMPINAASGLDI